MTTRGTIRFEDLGEPVQRLLKSLKGGYTEEDMALLEYVSVKDMAKIYGEMYSDRHVEEIWRELRLALQTRREQAARREAELLSRQQRLELECAAEAAKMKEKEVRDEEKEEKEEEAALQRAAERAERRRRRREARARELQEEQDALAAERAKHEAATNNKKKSQKKAWEEYVANHPLEFNGEAKQVIQQTHVEHTMKAPPQASSDLLNRTYTPKCPKCGTRFVTPPQQWECPLCFRRHRQRIKVWQPDDATGACMICHSPIGRFSRHHCRSCGRLVCNQCSDTRGVVPSLGFTEITKICDDCANMVSQLSTQSKVQS
ncbi:FYVE zinc finger [Trypanosoma melophagium]|uniref:FYVE zinc finger n=1 Tax=Trypanosoma melophagium TaxID=715481 RepID=UPI00351A50FA|nr:FYVE zinc finger [Trypanosoma melophagium]